jgi:spermidine/putrescine transport system permease protein
LSPQICRELDPRGGEGSATFPLYLYGALRFPSRLPEVIAVAVVVMTVSLVVVVAAELGRRVAERRPGALPG